MFNEIYDWLRNARKSKLQHDEGVIKNHKPCCNPADAYKVVKPIKLFWHYVPNLLDQMTGFLEKHSRRQ